MLRPSTTVQIFLLLVLLVLLVVPLQAQSRSSGAVAGQLDSVTLKPSLQIRLPYAVAYETKTPIACEFMVAPGIRR